MNDQELNLKFVGEVEKHEELYNYKLPDYSRKEVTEKAWKEVAAQVNMSAAECRKRWRNIRTVFKRKMKPLPSGVERKKKAYYLENALQFCLPFMHLPPGPTDLTCDVDLVVGDPETCEDSDSLVEDATLSSKQPTSHSSLSLPQQPSGQASQFSSTKRKLTLENKSATETVHPVPEYCKSKMASFPANEAESNCQRIDKHEALKMFLLSLIPELEELSDCQIKKFKRRVLIIIDEIASS